MAGRRMLQRNICKSRKLHQVSAEAERVWTRLLTCVDDNGNFEFDAALVRSALFPLSTEISVDEIERWLRELIDVRNGQDSMGLLAEYEVGGHRYLHYVRFEEFQVIPRGKYPHVEHPPHPEALGRVLKDHGMPILPESWKDRWAHLNPDTTGEVCRDVAGECRGLQGSSEKRSEVNRKEKKSSAHPALAPAREFAFRVFEEKFRQKPTWTAKDFVQLADLFKRRPELTLAEFMRRWKFYMASTDPFFAKRGFSLAYFCASFDSFLAGPVHGKPGAVKKSMAQQVREDEQRRNEVSAEGRKVLARFN